MKLFAALFTIILLGILHTNAQPPDSLITAPKTKTSGLVLITNNAFAPIPAFSFDNPAIMAFLTIKKGRMKYEPDLSVGLNGIPWMWNNWFRYSPVETRNFTLRGGLNPGLFFRNENPVANERTLSAHRNLTGEVYGKYLFTGSVNAAITYRFNKAFDAGTLDGHSIDLTVEWNRIAHYKKYFLNLRPQVFYFDSEGVYKGFYGSLTIAAGHEKLPVLLAYQGVQSFWTNFLPQPVYNANVSLIYPF